MFNPERTNWTAEQFRAEFEALNRELHDPANPLWDTHKQADTEQLMNEIGLDFLECYEMVCGEWVRRKDEPGQAESEVARG